MNWLLPALGALQFFGGQQANQQASRASEAENKIVDYILSKRQKVYDPLEEQTLLPRLRHRATTAPFFARDWLNQARALRQPMELNY
jgi:hypothetical protein